MRGYGLCVRYSCTEIRDTKVENIIFGEFPMSQS